MEEGVKQTASRRLEAHDATTEAERSLEAIERLNPVLNALLAVMRDRALDEARAADAAATRLEWLGLLHGAMLTVKDCMDVAGVTTTFGSGAYRDNVAMRDATVVARLRAAGAVLLGKNNLHEWCFGGTTQNDHFGGARNPWDPARIPGGSSGGSAAAVASEMCRISLGTDTGGSVRIPAAMCGVTGLRPTVGRVPNTGVVEVSAGFDTVGPLAYHVSDVARAFAAIAGYDPRDPLSAQRVLDDVLCTLKGGVAGLRIGVPAQFYFDDTQPDVAQAVLDAVRTFETCGATIRTVALDGAAQAHEDSAFAVAVADAADVHRARIAHEPDTLGAETLRRLRLGLEVSAIDYAAASRRLARWKAQLASRFDEVDVIMTPTCPFVAPKIEGATNMIETTRGLTRFTFALGHSGAPAISLPCGFDRDGMPIGLQLVAPWFSEAVLFRAGFAYQAVTDFHRRRPPIVDRQTIAFGEHA